VGCTDGSSPNVILISIDTLRADGLGSYGQTEPTSPALDRLAREGVRFADVVTQSTKTGPAHRAILTGVIYHAQDANTRTLAGILSDAGYDTAAFVDGGYMNTLYGHDKGFDLYVDGRTGPEDGSPPRGEITGRGGLPVVLPEARAWLEERTGDRPFFLFLHTYDVHCPYAPPEPYASLFTKHLEEPADPGEGPCWAYAPDRMTQSNRQWLTGSYLGGIRYTDELLGAFLEDLRENAALAETVVVVISDHGESLGERGWVGHQLVHAPQLFVPWIMTGPGLPRGRVVEAPAQLVDMVPTLLDYLDLTPSKGRYMGESLMTAVRGEGSVSKDRLRYCEMGTERAILKGPWALEQRSGAPDVLYRYRTDPLATRARVVRSSGVRNSILQEYLDLLALHGANLTDLPEEPEPDERTLEQLRSLGYVN
jgi:arylsulfatase A-like enzyme